MVVQCMTLRDNTERPEKIGICINKLLVTNIGEIKPALEILFASK